MLVLHKKPKYQRKYRVEHLAYSPDGRWLAAAVYRTPREGWQRQKEGRVLTWDLAGGGETDLKLEEEHLAGLGWTPDGQRLAVVTQLGRVYLWAAWNWGFAASNHEIVPPLSATCLAAAPDNQTALVTHGNSYRWGDGGVHLVHWRLRGPELSFQTETLLEHVAGGVWSIAVSPADGMVALGLRDGVSPQSFPDLEERSTIFRIHLSHRMQEPSAFDLGQLVMQSEGFSGAEIEQAVIAGLYRSLHEKRPLDTELLVRELRETVPLSISRREDIDRLRAMARERFVPVR